MTAREQAIEAAARAIWDEAGPECIDDDGADALAQVALAAALPVLLNDLADRIEDERMGDEIDDWNVALIKAAETVRAAAEGWGRMNSEERSNEDAALRMKISEIAAKAEATPRRNDPFFVGMDIANDLRAALAAAESSPDCCDHSGGMDTYGCWDCQNTGHAHATDQPCPAIPTGPTEETRQAFIEDLAGLPRGRRAEIFGPGGSDA